MLSISLSIVADVFASTIIGDGLEGAGLRTPPTGLLRTVCALAAGLVPSGMLGGRPPTAPEYDAGGNACMYTVQANLYTTHEARRLTEQPSRHVCRGAAAFFEGPRNENIQTRLKMCDRFENWGVSKIDLFLLLP